MKFLLQVVSAIRTNNVRKIPQHDPTLLEHMKKVLRGLSSGVYLINHHHSNVHVCVIIVRFIE